MWGMEVKHDGGGGRNGGEEQAAGSVGGKVIGMI